MKAYVYIMKDMKGKFYIGSTVDVQKRLQQHKLGHTQTTKNMIEPKIVLIQEVTSLLLARRIENKLKRMKRKDFIEKIVIDGYIKIAK